MRFIKLTHVNPPNGAEETVYVQPSKIVRMLRIHPNFTPDETSYTHIGYGWSYGTNSEVCDHVKEDRDEIIRRIRGANKSDPDSLTI